jgi:hypothetical protein
MDDKALVTLKATAALTAIAEMASEVAALATRLHTLADSITATIDPLAPAVGTGRRWRTCSRPAGRTEL